MYYIITSTRQDFELQTEFARCTLPFKNCSGYSYRTHIISTLEEKNKINTDYYSVKFLGIKEGKLRSLRIYPDNITRNPEMCTELYAMIAVISRQNAMSCLRTGNTFRARVLIKYGILSLKDNTASLSRKKRRRRGDEKKK